MTGVRLIVYQGKGSQTGKAFSDEFPKISFEETKYTFDEIRKLVGSEKLQMILPIWNSHAGEVTFSHALTMLFDEVARLYYLWPKQIKFECYEKPCDSKQKSLISVKVAKDQCSQFISEHGYIFYSEESTVTAYNKFTNDTKFDAVLCAPDTNQHGFSVLRKDAANPINFTTFVLLGSSDSIEWGGDEWGAFSDKSCKKNIIFSAIQMPFSQTLTDTQEELFDKLIEDAESIHDVPKILFVAMHENASSFRLLIESVDEIFPSEFLTEDGADDEIYIVPNVGNSAEKYSERVNIFLDGFETAKQEDFIKHLGAKTCFFACPALGIVTHGFEVSTTEYIVRQLIRKCFELMDKGITVTGAHKHLYDMYVDDYHNKGIDFVVFNNIGL